MSVIEWAGQMECGKRIARRDEKMPRIRRGETDKQTGKGWKGKLDKGGRE